MHAIQKMKAFGIELLAEKTGNHPSVLYRWMKSIEHGPGIRDPNKRKLMEATAGSAQAIRWSDFDPAQVAA